MDHSQAKQKMVSERYLLGELAPEELDAFEDHMFGCPECALDVRAGDAFMQEAKAQLSHAPAHPAESGIKKANKTRRNGWSFFSWKPIFAAPVLATLLGVIAYQNLATIPGLRSEATQPRIVPWGSLHLGARGAEATPLRADPVQGAVLLVQLPQSWTYTQYQFDFYNAGSERLWTRTFAASEHGDGGSSLSLVIPAHGLQPGSYTLAVSGISSQGVRTEIDRRALAIYFEK